MKPEMTMWDNSLPIITLWQPWASWVMLGWKRIETRTHQRFKGLSGKWIGIHASVKWDEKAIEAASPYLLDWQIAKSKNFLKIGGAVIGRVAVTNFRPLTVEDSKCALIECESVQRYGLVLAYPHVVEAIPARGKQGIWYLKDLN